MSSRLGKIRVLRSTMPRKTLRRIVKLAPVGEVRIQRTKNKLLHHSGRSLGLCPDGYEFPCYGRDYAFLTQTGLPKAFHRFSRLAMITPSPSCDASSCV